MCVSEDIEQIRPFANSREKFHAYGKETSADGSNV